MKPSLYDIKEIQAKSILTPCRIPGIDFTVNPYIGCRFGCIYCYASFMGRFVGKQVSDWGGYVFPKINASELLAREIQTKLKNKGKEKEIFFSSVTDCYQGLEAKYELTRKCLQVLADFEFAGVLSLLTKSKLVTSDIDILRSIKNVTVGLTVTSTDDSISRYFETYAPSVRERFEALKILNKNGIPTYAFLGPLLPHFVAEEKEIEKIFQKLTEVGTKNLYIEHLNFSPYIKKRMLSEMKDAPKEIIEKFYSSQSKSYRDDLNKIISKLVKKYRMNLILDMVIYHKEFMKH